MGIRAIHTLGGTPVFIKVPGDAMPSESIDLIHCQTNGGTAFTIPALLKSDAQYYREYLAKQQKKQDNKE